MPVNFKLRHYPTAEWLALDEVKRAGFRKLAEQEIDEYFAAQPAPAAS